MRHTLLAAATLAAASQTYGEVYYEYTSAPFTHFTGVASPGAPEDNLLKMIMATPEGLTDGLTIDDSDIDTFDVQLFGNTISHTQFDSVSISITFGPDLLPTAWFVDLVGDVTLAITNDYIFSGSTSTPGVYTNSFSIDGTLSSNAGTASSSAGSFSELGTWRIVPSPGTASCLIGAGVFSLLRRGKPR
jgi:hypothetical protein